VMLDDAGDLWPPGGTIRTAVRVCVLAEATDAGLEPQGPA
jgi:hypothetical protein